MLGAPFVYGNHLSEVWILVNVLSQGQSAYPELLTAESLRLSLMMLSFTHSTMYFKWKSSVSAMSFLLIILVMLQIIANFAENKKYGSTFINRLRA